MIQVQYKVALATPPSEDVTVTIDEVWVEGQDRPLQIGPVDVLFSAGEGQVWKTVTVDLPYGASALGNGTAILTHTAFSEDPQYNSGSPGGAPPVDVTLLSTDKDTVGVCLARCRPLSPYDYVFRGGEEGVSTPYEVVGGQVPLDFLLSTAPRGDVQLSITASTPLGGTNLLLGADSESAAGMLSMDELQAIAPGTPSQPLSLPFGPANWTTATQMTLQVRWQRKCFCEHTKATF